MIKLLIFHVNVAGKIYFKEIKKSRLKKIFNEPTLKKIINFNTQPTYGISPKQKNQSMRQEKLILNLTPQDQLL